MNSFDKKAMMSRVKKSQMYLEHVPKLEKEYNNVISSNFRTLEVENKTYFKNQSYTNLIIRNI